MRKTIEQYFIRNEIKDKELYALLDALNLTNKDVVDFIYKFHKLLNTKVDGEKNIAEELVAFIKDTKNDEILRKFGVFNDISDYTRYFEKDNLDIANLTDVYDNILDKENDNYIKKLN